MEVKRLRVFRKADSMDGTDRLLRIDLLYKYEDG
jgi:hypothetical protein